MKLLLAFASLAAALTITNGQCDVSSITNCATTFTQALQQNPGDACILLQTYVECAWNIAKLCAGDKEQMRNTIQQHIDQVNQASDCNVKIAGTAIINAKCNVSSIAKCATTFTQAVQQNPGDVCNFLQTYVDCARNIAKLCAGDKDQMRNNIQQFLDQMNKASDCNVKIAETAIINAKCNVSSIAGCATTFTQALQQNQRDVCNHLQTYVDCAWNIAKLCAGDKDQMRNNIKEFLDLVNKASDCNVKMAETAIINTQCDVSGIINCATTFTQTVEQSPVEACKNLQIYVDCAWNIAKFCAGDKDQMRNSIQQVIDQGNQASDCNVKIGGTAIINAQCDVSGITNCATTFTQAVQQNPEDACNLLQTYVDCAWNIAKLCAGDKDQMRNTIQQSLDQVNQASDCNVKIAGTALKATAVTVFAASITAVLYFC